ncbi:MULTISPECIES: HAD family hydrolase [Pseudomonas]|jgi:HAD superfamily hydrolase (TIGR01493 family)|uniref:HAD family hydrolase n=1 Tax=Pseudomonas TaxID=286 RepID=UPI0009536C90|nr:MULTISPECIES: HAD family hydrolase [Pseudomonas]WLG65440.1 HAD family hydrolase [Pseudomonas brassicacearum]SIS02811.1 Haloacid dehalogenase superfamily, subfamily IA, variant 2 with 3rd motif like haloacid dehalogenase [Pseudomonas sp. A214]
MIAAVIFDLFGTLVEIQNRQNPYRELLRIGAQQGRAASPSDLRSIMAINGGLAEAADFLEIQVSQAQLANLQRCLDLEIQSIKPFDDAVPAIELLRENQIKIALCSNLAGPYCSIARKLFPDLDGYALSAELGLLKPDPAIYRSVCTMLDVIPGQVPGVSDTQLLMIGDSKRCDEQGPRAVGILGHYLDRKGGGRIKDLLSFAQGIIASNP